MPQKNTPKTNRDRILKELQENIKELPEDGLSFLLEQAHVIQYNMKVDELNKAGEKLHSSGKSGQGKSSPQTAEAGAVKIEKGLLGNSMILIINGERKIMDEEEIYALVFIAHKASTKKEGAERLFRWLNKERDDVILDAEIDPGDQVLETLYSYLRKNFSIKK